MDPARDVCGNSEVVVVAGVFADIAEGGIGVRIRHQDSTCFSVTRIKESADGRGRTE